MNAKYTQMQKAIASLALMLFLLSASDSLTAKEQTENRKGNIPYYTVGMRLATNEIHDQGRKYIGVAVPSLKTDHYTMRLDSIDKTTDLTRREFYQYDENYRIAQTYEIVFAWGLEWINWWQYFYEYNDLGYITLAYDNRWDNFIKEWVPYRKYEYTYNENNSIILYLSYEWNIEQEEWRYIGKDEFTYTPFYFVQEIVISNWQKPFGEEGRWVPWYKNEYFYNNSFALMELIESLWGESSDKWRLRSKTVYERMSLGRKSVETIYSFDDNEWIGNKKYEYTYPSGNNFNILTKKGSQFNWWETQEWENMDSLAFTFHPISGFIESENYFSWRGDENVWRYSERDEYQYDDNDNLIRYQKRRWRMTINDWEDYKLEEAVFSSTNLSSEYIVKPFWYDWRNMIDEYKSKNWETDRWRETNHTLFYYSPLDATSIDQQTNLCFRVYPNPARNIVNIEYDGLLSEGTFALYDLAGKKIMNRSLSGTSKIELDGILPGLYLYNITVPGQTRAFGKLMVSEK